MIEWTDLNKPTAYIVGGPNGSGKTTLLYSMFGDNPLIEILNADTIAFALNPETPEKAAISAGREILKKLNQFRKNLISFAFETTLSGVWFAKFLRNLKDDGFKIVIVFVWLRSENMALERIENRRSLGGHLVPEDDVRRRYLKSFHNMQNLYRYLADDWFFYDNSDRFARLVASKQNGRFKRENKRLFTEILREVRFYEQSTKKD